MGESVKAVSLVLSVMLATILFTAQAGAASKPLDESQKLFFNQFRYAVQAHDADQLIRLTHPKSLECVPDEDREFYYGEILDGLIQVLGKRQIIKTLRVQEFVPGEFDITQDLLSGENVNWPVVPEAKLIIQYSQQDLKAVASLYLAKDNNDWKWIHVCVEKMPAPSQPLPVRPF